MSYVDAGYAVALATLFVYAIYLVTRRRRLERALRASEAPVHDRHGAAGAPPHGGRS